MSPFQGIIFDLDGTLHRDDGAAMAEAYLDAGSRAAVALGANLSLEEARRVATRAFNDLGSYARGFELHGVDPTDFHFKFHEVLDERAIEPVSGVIEAIENCRPQNFVLLTHASRDWAMRSIARLGLDRYFPSSRIVAFEDYEFCGKDVADIGFVRALAELETRPEETALIEDSRRNLPIPAAMGIRPFLVNYRRPRASKDPCAYREVGSVIEAIEGIVAHNRAMVVA